jgi:VIT1/CCC1 family predicted Fe2+/Mn2+ transporter
LGGAKLLPAVVRNVFGGTLVMIITYSVGTLIGGTGIG